jgi:peptidyl-prolyl cis-trans isomerase A (cyclophilin A)
MKNKYCYIFTVEGTPIHRRKLLTLTATCFGGLFAGCLTSGGSESTTNAEPESTTSTEPESTDNSQSSTAQTATLQTNRGEITVDLYGDRAPRTVENFVGLATGSREWIDPGTGETVTDEPLYDDVLFHRVIDGFMIQTGDPTGTGRGGPGYQFDDEFHDELRHDSAGTLSMANSGPNTNGSQFFITLDATPHLDGRHSVFGQVTDGMAVVREIGSVETDANDRPLEDVVLESVSVGSE